MSSDTENKGKGATAGQSRPVPAVKPGKVGEPPAKSKRTFSDVSETSVEELSIINQQLECLTSELKETKDKVMSLMSKEDVQGFITKAIDNAMNLALKKLEELMDSKVKEKTKEIEEKIEGLEFENGDLKDRLKQTETDLKTCMKNIRACEKLVRTSAQKSNYNEQYSRKNNVKIFNIPEVENETKGMLTDGVCTELLARGNVDLNPDDIMAIHRIPGKLGVPKPVLVKLKNNSAKTKVMKQRKAMKEAGHKLVDDVTKLNTGLIGRLLKHAKIDSAWYFNGAVYGKTTEGKRHKFDIYCSTDAVINPVDGAGGEDEAMAELEEMILDP